MIFSVWGNRTTRNATTFSIWIHDYFALFFHFSAFVYFYGIVDCLDFSRTAHTALERVRNETTLWYWLKCFLKLFERFLKKLGILSFGTFWYLFEPACNFSRQGNMMSKVTLKVLAKFVLTYFEKKLYTYYS